MSHSTLRQEKNCLNCGSHVEGRYCQNCGQENLPPQESVWHFITHFFNDVTHFDGKFFKTLKYLILKPGYLTRQYMLGKRASYLNPIRMYLFTSFLFFLIFYSFYKPGFDTQPTFQDAALENINHLSGSQFDSATAVLNHGKPMTHEEFVKYKDSVLRELKFSFSNDEYQTTQQYDSAVKTMQKTPSWLSRKFNRKLIEIQQKYKQNQNGFFNALWTDVIHQFPKMLFISLPLAALLLQLLYWRRKQFYYVIHGVFSIHFYIFVFIAILVQMGIIGLKNQTGWDWLLYLNTVITLLIFFYLYKAMRNFYGQKRGKTILKYLLFVISFFIVLLLTFSIFFVETFLTV